MTTKVNQLLSFEDLVNYIFNLLNEEFKKSNNEQDFLAKSLSHTNEIIDEINPYLEKQLNNIILNEIEEDTTIYTYIRSLIYRMYHLILELNFIYYKQLKQYQKKLNWILDMNPICLN